MDRSAHPPVVDRCLDLTEGQKADRLTLGTANPISLSFVGCLRGPVQLLQQALRSHRLDQVQLKSSLSGALLVLLTPTRRDGNQLYASSPRLLAKNRREFVAVAVRQA